MLSALSSLITLSVLIAAGYAAVKTKLIDGHSLTGLSNLLIKITLPATIFMTLQTPFSADLLGGAAVVLAVSTAVQVVCIGFGYLVCKMFKVKKKQISVWVFSMAFANVGFMGFPFIHEVLGIEARFFASVYNVTFNLLACSAGVLIMRGRKGGRSGGILKTLSEPVFVVSAAGTVMFLFSLRLPGLLEKGIDLLSAMTSPLAMIIIGAILAQNRLLSVFTERKLYLLAFFKLLFVPAVLFFIINPFIADRNVLAVLVYLSAMPAAAIVGVFSIKYGGDRETASKVLALTTVLSVVTLPLISLLF